MGPKIIDSDELKEIYMYGPKTGINLEGLYYYEQKELRTQGYS